MAKLLPPNKSSITTQKQANSLLKTNKFFSTSTKTKTTKVNVATKESPKLLEDTLTKIEKKVIKIDKLLKDSLLLSKKENERKRVGKEKESFEGKEKELEKKKPKATKGAVQLPTSPKMSFLDRIKNFIIQTVLGFITVRLIEHLPKLLSLLPTIIKVTDFITDLGGKLLDGLVTFVDWGYKAIDGTRQFAKQLGGEGLAKNFDKFAGAIDNVLEIAIITALATADSGGGGDLVGDFFKKRAAQQTAKTVGQQAAGAAGRTAGIGAGAAAGIVAGAGLLASALGEGAFQIRKVAIKPIQNLENEYKSDRNPLTKIGRGIVLNMVRPLYGVFSTVGFLLDVVGAPFRYAIELLRYPFLSDEDKVKQEKNLAKFDSRIREDLRKALNMLTLGFAFKEKGSFGNIYGNKGAQKEMMSKMAGGGQPATRGGKPVTGPTKRTLKKKKKAPRTLRATPSKLKPGGAVGGEKQIKKLYPESKDKTKMSPFDFLKNSYDAFSKTTGLGALVALAIKPLMGDRPSYADYKNVGVGINNWMNSTISSSGTMAYAGGGEVKMESIVSGKDYSDVIAKSVQESVAPEVDKTIQDLMKQLMLKKVEPEVKEKEPTGEPTTPEGIPLDEGSTASGRSLMQGLVQRGFTKEEASAIVGNLWAESGFRTNAINPSSGAFGLMQWLGGRKSRLYSYAAEKGKSVTDANLQLDYIKWELKGGNAYETAQFQKAMAYGSSVADKTRGFAYEVERASSGELSRSMSKRVGAAESVYGGRMVAGETPSPSSVSLKGGSGKFIQGNSGASQGIHFHIGPGSQPGVVDTKYNADARTAASKVVKHFLGKKTLYDGRRKTNYTSASDTEMKAAQRAHSASGSQGGIDIQVGGTDARANKIAFPFAVSNMAERPGGFGVSAMIDGLNAFVAHGRYNQKGQIARQGGRQPYSSAEGYAFHGKVGIVSKDGMTLNLHKGEMYKVVDKDSVDLFGRDFIQDVIDIENKSQLVARAPSIIEKLKSISGYTDYEQSEPEVQYIEVPVEVPVPMPVPMGRGGSVGGGGVNSNDSFDRLAIG